MTDAMFLTPLDGAVAGAEVLLDGPEGHHAVAVRRIRVGERVLLADGRGTGASGVAVTADKQGLRVRLDDVFTEPEPALRVVVAQALAKGDRAELAVETMTEMGVSAIIPWQSARSVVKWSDGERGGKQRGRWESSVREAAKQARRCRVPEVTQPLTTAGLCARIAAGSPAFVLHEDAPGWLAGAGIPQSGELLLIVGPEGGIAPEEREAFAAAGAQEVRIAQHVLRTSTAGVVALAQVAALVHRGQHGGDERSQA